MRLSPGCSARGSVRYVTRWRPRRSSRSFPATDAAVRAGSVLGEGSVADRGGRDLNPAAEAHLLHVARQGLVPLTGCVCRGAGCGRGSDEAAGTSACGSVVSVVDRPGRDVGGSVPVSARGRRAAEGRYRASGRSRSSASTRPGPSTNRTTPTQPTRSPSSSLRPPPRKPAATQVTVHVVVGNETLKRGAARPG